MQSLVSRSVSAPAARQQEPFARVAPVIGTALLLGASGGFALAAILTLTRLLRVPLGPWWVALAQAHGHLQIYGWAGLFVLGVAFHFLPRMRGAPLAFPRLVPWIVALQAASLLLRTVSQPLMAAASESLSDLWRAGLLVSGALEVLALLGAVALIAATVVRGPALASRPALRSVLPFIAVAFVCLALASVINAANLITLAVSPRSAASVIPEPGDALDVTLGLFGFLMPMALAMSARSLPMYAGLEAFPKRLLWPLAYTYAGGLALTLIGALSTGGPAGAWSARLGGMGMITIGSVLCLFVAAFMRVMRTRGRLPRRVATLAPDAGAAAQNYRSHITNERGGYGPFVALVASAYLWAVFGGILLTLSGCWQVLGQSAPIPIDAPRHSLALGFIALLICGVAPRMLPGFSGGRILSPRLVAATLWLGNGAAALRVGSLLVTPVLAALGPGGISLDTILFGLSGPLGLALAICLAVNLWPALKPAAHASNVI
ncbi:MAG TPA: hypothetical protein VKT52_05300 [Ktedonobacterales bacterium]|nr:hypothetical protein [Ktedonobacterales bacterium]